MAKGFGTNTSVKSTAPFVTVNPKNILVEQKEIKDSNDNVISTIDEQFLTGDGVLSESINAIKNDENRYKNVVSEKSKFKDGDYSNKISTFKTIMKGYDSNDFPVFVVDSIINNDVTNQLTSYIQMLTNSKKITNYADTTDPSDGSLKLFGVSVTTYRYSEGKFISEGTDNTFEMYNSYFFRMTGRDSSDINKTQFSLIDVMFYDPTNLSKKEVVYNLYVPVVVVKALKFDFSATLLSGTGYDIQNYDGASTTIVAPLGQSITSRLEYTYKRLISEWNDVISQGDRLLVSVEKAIKLDGELDLPPDTKLVLIDTSSYGEAYYSDIATSYDNDENILYFKNFSPDVGDVSLGDLNSYDGNLFVSSWTSGDMYIKVENANDSDIQVNGEFYKRVEYYSINNLFASSWTSGDKYIKVGTADDSDIQIDGEFYKRVDDNNSYYSIHRGVKFKTLNDMLEQQGTFSVTGYTNENGANKYVKTTNIAEADIRVTTNGVKEYYKYVPSEDTTPGPYYSISYSADNPENFCISESYFISIFTEQDSEDKNIYNEYLTSPTSLRGTSTLVDRIEAPRFILGNFYEQSVELVTHEISNDGGYQTDDDNRIDETNNFIKATIISNIGVFDENKAIFDGHMGEETINVYHDFKLYLTVNEGVNVNRNILGSPTYDVTYKLYKTADYENYVNDSAPDKTEPVPIEGGVTSIFGEEVETPAAYIQIKSTDSVKAYLVDGLTIKCDITITYSSVESQIEQFPLRTNQADGENRNYVVVDAYSNLAYSPEGLATTTITSRAYDNKPNKYYREDTSIAKLTYNVPPVQIDDPDGSFSQLGINPLDGGKISSLIKAKGNYYFADVIEQETYNEIMFSLELLKKNDDGGYIKVDNINDYLDNVCFYMEDNEDAEPLDSSSTDSTFVYRVAREDPTTDKGMVDFRTCYDVKTGEGFGEAEYANYRVKITGVLVDDLGETNDDSSDYDHITYTNAKIMTKIKINSSQGSSS